MKRLLAATISLSMLVATPALAANINVENASSWNIEEVYFAPSSQENWGEDHLGSEILETGMTLELSGVSAGLWDVRLVDEDGDVCVVQEVRIRSSDTWTITDDDLLDCQSDTDE